MMTSPSSCGLFSSRTAAAEGAAWLVETIVPAKIAIRAPIRSVVRRDRFEIAVKRWNVTAATPRPPKTALRISENGDATELMQALFSRPSPRGFDKAQRASQLVAQVGPAFKLDGSTKG